ncbi:MAG: hypothetical protein ACREK7_07860 [Gemmatimonadota bacterium]
MIDSPASRTGTDPAALCRALLRVFLVAALAVAFVQRLAQAQTVEPAPAHSPPAPAHRPPAIPLEVGSSWTYVGQVWWIPRHRIGIYREHVTWTSEVTAMTRRRGWTAAMLEGHPYDLLESQQGRARGTYVLLLRGRKGAGPRVFLVGGQRAWDVWRRIQDREDTLDGLALPKEFVLELPLRGGKPICPPTTPDEPTSPCWSVTNEGPADLRAVRGGEEIQGAVRYSVSQRTPAQHAVWTFVPGLGFTSFAFGQEGEISAVELQLVDYHAPSAIGETALDD